MRRFMASLACAALLIGCTRRVTLRPQGLPRGGIPLPNERPDGGLALQTVEGGYVMEGGIRQVIVHRKTQTDRFADPMGLNLDADQILRVEVEGEPTRTYSVDDVERLTIEMYSPDETGEVIASLAFWAGAAGVLALAAELAKGMQH